MYVQQLMAVYCVLCTTTRLTYLLSYHRIVWDTTDWGNDHEVATHRKKASNRSAQRLRSDRNYQILGPLKLFLSLEH